MQLGKARSAIGGPEIGSSTPITAPQRDLHTIGRSNRSTMNISYLAKEANIVITKNTWQEVEIRGGGRAVKIVYADGMPAPPPPRYVVFGLGLDDLRYTQGRK